MGLFGEYFGSRYLNLADTNKEVKQISRPNTVDNTSVLKRATKDVIRELYHSDWFTFSQVNIVTSLFSRPRIDIISKDKKSWEKFFEDMRNYGTNTSLKRLRSEIKRDSVGYGTGYVEYIYDTDGEEILDLKKVDASKIAKAKIKGKDNLILDSKGNSIGYILRLGTSADLRSKGDNVPTEYIDLIDKKMGDIFLLPHRIAEFPLYVLGNDSEALGIIEPSIIQTNRRKNLETTQVNALWINGSGLPYIKVGNDTHEPNPQMMEDALDMAANIRTSQAIAIPHYNEFGTINAKMDSISTDIMNNLLAASAGAGNVPLPFITGAGEATNRSTLLTQREIFELSIQEKIDRFDQDWNNQIMATISSINKIAEGQIVSEEIRLESKDEVVKRLKTIFDMGAISPKEIREYVLATESIQRDDSSYDKYIKEKKESAEKKEMMSENSTEDLSLEKDKIKSKGKKEAKKRT